MEGYKAEIKNEVIKNRNGERKDKRVDMTNERIKEQGCRIEGYKSRYGEWKNIRQR